MNSSAADICKLVKDFVGLKRKKPIQQVFEILGSTQCYGQQLPNYGDDAAVIPRGNEYLLLATDGMMPGLIYNEPYAAGKAAVMVTVNDIYAMGGRPLGMVNVLASGDQMQREQILKGIEKGCHKLQVPMLGGHLHPDVQKEMPSLSVAILGQARKLLRGHLARPQEDLILAVDLQGQPGCTSVQSWDANSGKSSGEILNRLEALPLIAELGWSQTAKDVSNAGILGTLAIMLENSGLGGVIDLQQMPCPQGIEMKDWLLCFQSFGFVLSVPPSYSREVIGQFEKRQVSAKVVGRVEKQGKLYVRSGREECLFFDFEQESITGISCLDKAPISKK